MKPIVRIAAIAAVAALAIGASKPRSNWLRTVAVTANGGHVLGNPQAKVKLTEYLSYTCDHCAHFHTEADGPLKMVYVMPGKVSLEVQHFIRDPVDLTVAMLTNCGKSSDFFLRHNDFMSTQDAWMGKLGGMTQAQQARWYNGPTPARLQAVANDFGFYTMMEKRGITRTQANRCLSDQAMAQRITQQTVQATEKGVEGTPSFAINGVLLAGTHSWSVLDPQLASRF